MTASHLIALNPDTMPILRDACTRDDTLLFDAIHDLLETGTPFHANANLLNRDDRRMLLILRDNLIRF